MQLKIKNLTLIINTAVDGQIFVALVRNGFLFQKLISNLRSDKLLQVVDKLLRRNKFKIKNINGIIVVSGPGSFTAVRTGVVVANAIGFALHIPVADVKLSEFKNEEELIRVGLQKLKKIKSGKIVLPFYGKEPNITKPRKV